MKRGANESRFKNFHIHIKEKCFAEVWSSVREWGQAMMTRQRINILIQIHSDSSGSFLFLLMTTFIQKWEGKKRMSACLCVGGGATV